MRETCPKCGEWALKWSFGRKRAICPSCDFSQSFKDAYEFHEHFKQIRLKEEPVVERRGDRDFVLWKLPPKSV